jgi:hypothetical protein
MVGRLLCFLGFHSWEHIETLRYTPVDHYGPPVYQRRERCPRCSETRGLWYLTINLQDLFIGERY